MFNINKMGLLSKIKNLLKNKTSNKYPKNFCIKFGDLDSFAEYVSENHDFNNNYLYFYRGKANCLAKLISDKFSDGEKDIPDFSLEYISGCEIKNNNIIFGDAIFFSDCVFDLIDKYHFLDQTKPHHCMYHSDTSGFHQIYKFVIARDNVYLCSK